MNVLGKWKNKSTRCVETDGEILASGIESNSFGNLACGESLYHFALWETPNSEDLVSSAGDQKVTRWMECE